MAKDPSDYIAESAKYINDAYRVHKHGTGGKTTGKYDDIMSGLDGRLGERQLLPMNM